MKLLFHAPVLSVHRPDIAMPRLLGVPPTVTDSLQGLAPAHRLTGNRGNIIHAEAPARMLRKDPEGSAVGNLAALQRALGDGYRAAMAAQFDMIVISLANFIRPDLEGHRLFDALEALDGAVPFVVLGAGLQGEFALEDLRASNRDLIALLNERAALFGVRGQRTAAWLAGQGWHNTRVLGCPSLYAYPQSILAIDGSAARAKGQAANVMTAGHLSLRHGAITERGRHLAEAFADIQASYVFQDEIFAYPGFRHDRFGYNEGNNIIPPRKLNRWLSRKSGVPINFNRYYYFAEAGAWRQASMLHDVYVGDRFHGGVAALQAGQPAIFLKHDNRVSELTAHFDLPALPTAEFAEMGLAAVLETYLAPARLTQMKETYRRRHGEFTAALAEVGLEVTTALPDAPAPVPPVTVDNRIAQAPKQQRVPGRQVTQLGNSYILRRSGPKDARELVVTFEGAQSRSNTTRSPERDAFGGVFLRRAGYAVLAVQAQADHWYQAPELAQALADPELRDWISGFEKVHTLGSAMGSFGALAYADLLGAHTVVALQPVTSLAADLVPEETGFAAGRRLDWSGGFRDGCAGSAGVERICVLHGLGTGGQQADPQLARLQAEAGSRARITGVAGCGAGVARHLRRQGTLAPAVLACLRAEDPAAVISP